MLVSLAATEARADWLITPFLGSTFSGQTTFVELEQGVASKQLIIGAAGSWLTDSIIGFEIDLAYAPRAFERDNRAGLIVSSNLTTLMGSVIVTAPLSVTRESLRPYLSGGMGLMHASLEDLVGIFNVDDNSLALHVGGGAIGFLTEGTGVRFDLRQIRSLARDEDLATGDRRSRLSFWRATIGVTFRY